MLFAMKLPVSLMCVLYRDNSFILEPFHKLSQEYS